MAQIEKKWIEDNAIDNDKIDNTANYTVNNLTTTSNLIVGGILDSTGDSTFTGTSIFNGDATFNSNVDFNGNVSGIDMSASDDLYVANRVGIGTTNPQAELHVMGNIVGSEADTGNLGSSARRWANLYMASTIDYTSGGSLSIVSDSSTMFMMDSSGKVGIGTTAPLGFVHANKGNAGSFIPSGSGDDFIITNSENAGMSIITPPGDLGSIYFGNSTDPTSARIVWDSTNELMTLGTSVVGSAQVKIVSGNDAEAVRISDSGHVGIGTGTPLQRLHVLRSVSNGYVGMFENSNGAVDAHVLVCRGGDNGSDTTANLIKFERADGTLLGDVRKNGSASVNYNTSSDERLKENIIDFDLDEAIEKIKLVQPRRFNFKKEFVIHTGFIAQELQPVYPDAVSGGPGDVDDNGLPKYMCVDYGRITPLLAASIKALIKQNENQKNEILKLKADIIEIRKMLSKR